MSDPRTVFALDSGSVAPEGEPGLPVHEISVQDYRWNSVPIGGGGFVTGIIHNPEEKDLVYLRTDVGGAYRWNPGTGTWIALQDGLGPEDWNLHGVESLATDALDPDRVYIAAGTYTNPKTGCGVMLRSADRGRTWQRTPLPFRLGGNEAGRGSGERLAVDPLDNRRLWFGTRRDGLWESLDRGETWHAHPGFTPVEDGSKGQVSEPGKWNFLAQAVGVVQVLFDPSGGPGSSAGDGGPGSSGDGGPGSSGDGGPGEAMVGGSFGCRVAWLAVSRHEDGLFVTRDGGQSWQIVEGQPRGLRPTCLSLGPGGLLYVSYSRDPGPNSMGPGAVWKLDTGSGQWTNITPERQAAGGTIDTGTQPGADAGTGGTGTGADDGRGVAAGSGETRHLSSDNAAFGHAFVQAMAGDPELLVCTSWYRGPREEIFLSADRGQSWVRVLEHARWNHDLGTWARDMKPHWLCDAALDPFHPGRLIFTTGYGIFTCPDIRPALKGLATDWTFDNRGIEETVPLALLSPATSLDQARLISGIGDIDGFVHHDLASPPERGRFDQPGFKNTECLAAAGLRPEILVRSGTTYHHDRVHAAWSGDGGQSWTPLASQPRASDPDRPAPMGGPITVSADGARIVWAPSGERPHHTDDRGRTWQPCLGLNRFIRVVADPEKPEHFLAWDTVEGEIWESTDKAASFRRIGSRAPAFQSPRGTPEGRFTFASPGWQAWLVQTEKTLYVQEYEHGFWRELEGIEVRTFGIGAGRPEQAAENARARKAQADSLRARGEPEEASSPWSDRLAYPVYPSVYIQGRIYGRLEAGAGPGWISGTFRSDDGLVTWTRIACPGDGENGFPTLRLLIGDSLIHGHCYAGTGGRGIFRGEPAGPVNR